MYNIQLFWPNTANLKTLSRGLTKFTHVPIPSFGFVTYYCSSYITHGHTDTPEFALIQKLSAFFMCGDCSQNSNLTFVHSLYIGALGIEA